MRLRNFKKIYLMAILAISMTFCCAQGQLSGGFETNTIVYFQDGQTQAIVPENNLGSNNYFKLDYQYSKFMMGVQYESYLPVLQGFPGALNGSDLVFKYASFQDNNLEVKVGDFYDQFGNGLIFRAYEERAVGLNTAIEGAHISYSFHDILRIKGLVGKPREFMKRAESTVKGISIALDAGTLFNMTNAFATVELNYLDRYMQYAGQEDINPNVHAYSLQGNWTKDRWILQAEYAYKSEDNSAYTNDIAKDGSAVQVEVGYNFPRFGSLLSFRRLEYMQYGTTRGITGIGRDLNYLPALTKQHTYALANLHPYNTMGNGEIGGQLDLYYQFQKGSTLGGKYGTKLSLNGSSYHNLQGDVANGFAFFDMGDKLYYQDLNVEAEKKLHETIEIHALFSNQKYNPMVIGKENTLYTSNIAAGDLVWKTGSQASLRVELQHLWSQDYQKNWAGSTVEYAHSANWSCFIGDLYNYGDTDIHYYKLGGSYSTAKTRFALNYGRNREGFICAGGVCLYMPAYTGLNLAITSSF